MEELETYAMTDQPETCPNCGARVRVIAGDGTDKQVCQCPRCHYKYKLEADEDDEEGEGGGKFTVIIAHPSGSCWVGLVKGDTESAAVDAALALFKHPTAPITKNNVLCVIEGHAQVCTPHAWSGPTTSIKCP